ncbi:MAG TPA: hypothetical protein VFV58_18485 [Blastocatellia bacterium]|nr:hypothetical protein [Blastocatellia bacterium]
MKEAFLLSLLISGSLVSITQEQKITIPMTAKEPADFAPAGWHVDGVKRGDLNGDKIDDAVIVITKPEVRENNKIVESEKNFLALAFSDGGQFKRTAFSGVPIIDTPMDMGINSGMISIENGVVVIEILGPPGDMIWLYRYRYRWQQNRWMLIGKTYGEEYRFQPDAPVNDEDTNLSTGLVSRTDASSFIKRGKKQLPMKGDYYELQAITTNEAQKIDGLFDPGEWQGYVLKLNAKRQVIRGVELWKGISDVSAVLNAVRQGDDLFIRAEVTDDQFSEGDGLRLVNEKGRIIAPKEIKTTPTPKGYNAEALYSMEDLEMLAGSDATLSGVLLSDEWKYLEKQVGFFAAVEIIDVDGKAKRATLSTRLRGSPFNGSIRAYQAGVAVLENSDAVTMRK